MLKPKSLVLGGTIGVVAPSGPVEPEAIHKASEFLKSMGHRVKLAANLFERRGYLAGTDQERAWAINKMFADPATDAIIVARGGYGSSRLLPFLDYEAIKRTPKILVGYSDATALEMALLACSGLISFYGPIAVKDLTLPTASFAFKSLRHALDAHSGTPLLPGRWPKTIKVLSPGRAEGRLIGGCLALLVSLLGTQFFPETEGAILFLEDIKEQPYEIDRYLTQLELSGVLSSVAGVLLGSFARCQPRGRAPSFTLDEVLNDRFANRGFPVVSGVPFGHIARKITIPQGVRAAIDTDLQALHLLESTCRA